MSFNIYSQWEADRRLTINSATSNTSLNNARSIAAEDDYVHVVWEDYRDGNHEIYYKRGEDYGNIWGPDIRLTNNSSSSRYPSVSVNQLYGWVNVVWFDDRDGNSEIYYKRSTDRGITWGPDIRLTNNPAISQYPSLSADLGYLHLVWYDYRDGNYEIYYKRSTNFGFDWGADIRLTNDPGYSIFPCISSDHNLVDIVWTDDRDTNDEVYYKHSNNYGNNWGADRRMTNNSGHSSQSCISTSQGHAYIVWVDDRNGNNELYFKYRSFPDWSNDIRLTNNPTIFKAFPSISNFGEVIHVVWGDARDGNWEIYYKLSSNRGIDWSADTRLTNAPNDSHYPSIEYSGQEIYVVWGDKRDGNQEIYFKRNPQGNPLTIQSIHNRYNLNKPILDNESTRDTIRTGDISNYSVLDVNLRIDTVLHTNDSDLEFYLIHNGITDTLIYQAGGSGDNYIGAMLNDSASTLISSGTAPFTGLYRPHKPLSQFNNIDVDGDWILQIYDRATGNTGMLEAWSLILTIQINPIGIQPVSNEIPEKFSLSQNYPNPFNPKTKIRFQIPKSGFVNLVIIDILGREITTLINENLSPGIFDANWDASGYPSGVYFYVLSAGEFSEAKKMVLIK